MDHSPARPGASKAEVLVNAAFVEFCGHVAGVPLVIAAGPTGAWRLDVKVSAAARSGAATRRVVLITGDNIERKKVNSFSYTGSKNPIYCSKYLYRCRYTGPVRVW